MSNHAHAHRTIPVHIRTDFNTEPNILPSVVILLIKHSSDGQRREPTRHNLNQIVRHNRTHSHNLFSYPHRLLLSCFFRIVDVLQYSDRQTLHQSTVAVRSADTTQTLGTAERTRHRERTPRATVTKPSACVQCVSVRVKRLDSTNRHGHKPMNEQHRTHTGYRPRSFRNCEADCEPTE